MADKINTQREQYDRDCKVTYKVPNKEAGKQPLKKTLIIGKFITKDATIDQVNSVCEAVASVLAYPVEEKFDVPKFLIEQI